MKIRDLSLFFFVAYSLSISAQDLIEINWENEIYRGVEISSFEDATYLSKYKGLPCYQQISKVVGGVYNELEFFDLKYIEVSETETNKLIDIDVTSDMQFSSNILRSNGHDYNQILIFPYIQQDGVYKKIQRFRCKKKDVKISPKIKQTSNKINSVLSNGDWYKISVDSEGVYALGFSELELLGINTASLLNSSIHIYGNSGGMLPKENSEFRHEDLIKNSISIIDNNDNGIFEDGDLIIFYGQDVDQWYADQDNIGRYSHEKHLYDDYNYYFLTVNNLESPKRIENYTPTLKLEPQFSDIFNTCQFHELDLVNFIQSGSNWYGEVFDANLTQSFLFNFPNIVDNSEVYIKTSLAARSFSPSSFHLSSNGSQIMSVSLNSVTSGFETDYASLASVSGDILADTDDVNITLTFDRNSSSHKGWLDYIEICALRNLIMTGSQMNFRKTIDSDQDQLYTLIIDNFSESDKVWNVTDPTNVKEHTMSFYSNNKFSLDYDVFSGFSDQKFIAFDGSGYLTPNILGKVNNQNLHADTDFDMLIVCYPDFIAAANKLSNFHLNNTGKKCKIVTPQQIYNEFSSGKQDISSIRDYCRYLYNIPSSNFKYLLLIGDASYDPKDRILNNTNFIITYQSYNSTSPLNTYATDDYFGCLDIDEGLFQNDLIDIGIGRLPSKSLSEANSMVDKIINYYSKSSQGDWKNMVCFIADDGDDSDGNIHMTQAESLSNIVDDNYNTYNFQKIYLDAYNQESTPVGPRSEDAKLSITNRINNGAILVNYTGHGGEGGLTQERIVDVDQILGWNNYDKLPLFVTATCEFGRFDNPDLTSAGEHIILNPDGGGVALLTTTRYVYSHLNYSLNTNFINTVFEKVDGYYQNLGDIFLSTKVLSGTSVNSKKFTLLGDPMMSIAYPQYNIRTTIFPDTVSALGKVTFNAEIIDKDSIKVSNFNGTVYIKVFDKESITETQGQQSSTPMPYRSQTNLIYKGKASVKDGEFSFSFIVPKDISYDLDYGRLSYYSSEEIQNIDASGWNESFIVGGISDSIIEDNLGPEIQLYMNDQQFVSGGLTDISPTFLAYVQDSSGINTVGNGIGHDITITIDGDISKKIILNEYYESDIDSYQSGKIQYPLQNLTEGHHTIEFKVWDVFNNSSESSLDFFVSESQDFVIEHLLNYPNPFTTNTGFYFEHNRPNQILEVQIQIFTASGKLVKTLNSLQNNNGFRIGPIYWDGKDDFNDKIGRGTYIYKLRVKDENGEYVQKLEKLVILR